MNDRRMPPHLQPVTSLSPPKGLALVLTDNETWVGRYSFKLSKMGQYLCSRRQACVKVTDTAVTLECHGLNPICFLVCNSVNFQASEDTPSSELHQLRRGEAVEIVDGDKFFLVLKECLLTVGIKPSGSELNEAATAAVHLTPGAGQSNIPDDRSLPDQVCFPQATQLGPDLTDSLFEQHRPLQTGVPGMPLSAEGCVNLADRRFTRTRLHRNLTVHNCCVSPSNESCNCNGVRNPSPGLEAPFVKDKPVFHVDVSTSATSGDPTSRKVVIGTRRSTIDANMSSLVSDEQRAPESSRLDASGSGDRFNPTHGGTLEVGSSAEGRGRGSSTNASKNILVQSFQADTLNCGLESTSTSEANVNSHPDAQQASKQTTTRVTSGRTFPPPLAASGDPSPGEVVIDTRRSISASQTVIVPDDGNVAEFSRRDSSATGGAPLNSTQEGCTLAATSCVEGRVRAHGSSRDTTGEIPVQITRPGTIACGLDSRGVPKRFVKSYSQGRFKCKLDRVRGDIRTQNIPGCTSTPLCPQLNQIQEDMPSAVISGSDSHQDPRLRRQLSPLQGNNTKADSRSKSVSSRQSAPRDCVSSGLPMTIGERRELPPQQPECVDLTSSEDEGDAQAQIRSESVQADHTVRVNHRQGPIEGMRNVVVTISGYEDLLRARLINLILATGASYTGSLTKRNTHVICWKFRGAKYEMAKKLGKRMISHCWFERCQEAGIRLSEEGYQASGEIAMPLRWDQSSGVQCPSSSAGFDRYQECNSPVSEEESLGQAQPSLVISGPSTNGGSRGEHPHLSVLLSRNEIDVPDRGKRHVHVSPSANWLHGGNLGPITHDSQVACQIRPSTRSGNSAAIDVSTTHYALEQESDEIWNEAMRAYEDRNNQVAEHSCQVVSQPNHRAGLMEYRTGITTPTASPTPGSWLRELDSEDHDEIGSGRRNALSNEAGPSGVAQGEMRQEAMMSQSLAGEQSDNVRSEVDHTASYPEAFQRKRKHATAIAKFNYTRFKRQRLARNSEASLVLGDSSNQAGGVSSHIECAAIAGLPTLNSGAAQESASAVDTKNECQQRDGVIDAESIRKAGEEGGASASSNEITCVICHSDTKPVTEGVLACGHQFCYPCIQRWADEAKSKLPTCPLCKVPFDFVTFREFAKAGENGGCAVLEERIVPSGHHLMQKIRSTNLPLLRRENLCVTCGSRDVPELLLICTRCRERACHAYCVDPPRPLGSSWFCSRCSEIQSRMETRRAYGRLFQGIPSHSVARQRQSIPDVGMNLAPRSSTSNRVGALITHESSASPLGMNLAQPGGSTSLAGGLAPGQSLDTQRQRGSQNPLFEFLMRRNDV